jgi:hypothetical protein
VAMIMGLVSIVCSNLVCEYHGAHITETDLKSA